MESLKEKIKKLILENSELFDLAFVKKFPSDDDINEAEKLLNYKIPEEYLWYLKTYGHGGNGFEFLGYSIRGEALFVLETLKERANGLPDNLLVIEECGEFVICIDTISKNIVSWSKFDNYGAVIMCSNFYEYFIQCINEAINN